MGIDFATAYRTSVHRLGRDFLGEVLPAAHLYQRAVGFFSSSVFAVAPNAWREFFAGGGRVRLVCSERVSPADRNALVRAVVDRPRWNRREWSDLVPREDGRGVECAALLSALVAKSLVQIKIAIRSEGGREAMYHEKIGLLTDGAGRRLAVSGSTNESWTAFVENFERIDVFPSWTGEEDNRRCQRIAADFDALWQKATPGLSILELSEAVLSDRLVADARESQSLLSDPADVATEISRPAEVLAPPAGVELFAHQSAAVRAWASAGGRGTLQMATGAGKTLTALSLASRLYDAIGPGLAIVVVAPFIHLVDQWIEVARRYGLRPIRCAESSRDWHASLETAILASNAGRRPLLSVVVTQATMTTPAFSAALARLRSPLLVIGDEVHNYGARRAADALPRAATYRLGLSATPDRWRDPEGTKRVYGYFGEVVYEYGLAEAIRDGVLTHYVYSPHTVALNADEFDQYCELTSAIGRYLRGIDEGELPEAAQRLLIRRARVVASAQAKLPLLRQLLSDRRHDTHILVYCGDGQVEGEVDGSLLRQAEEAVRIVGQELHMRCGLYTADTPSDRRRTLLADFDRGLIQVLVAIRCLDEGVDVPSTRTAILLASTTNPRQFVQRRGRVLRRHPSKARAEVHDIFVLPPPDDHDGGSPEYQAARSLVRGQLHRVTEFAALADNGPVARRQLLEIRSQFELLADLQSEDE